MNTEELKQELKQKERSISDLLCHITTRNDNNPNYSILLGAGCSVTSGIRSGKDLIQSWRKEIYQSLVSNENDYSAKEAIEYLVKHCGSWYNPSSEYSSLFEKKYDLPRQRRMFVEKEVSDKSPSIGYAYLINLIRDSYFNTLFTTNFDDLLNEAFYQFSEQRPMVCAHDSSINSITVTSKRPKIVKLHGDYLFDDIKSTLRETESLEDNIRNKFIEFSKEYGLIVVGYAGHDRSIMDVLNYLLKHEDYYKGGIYWCIRKGDEISEELRKLLWKDRVFFVEIDGFDELFSELHSNVYEGKLPIDTNFVSNKSQEIIEKFVNNKYLLNSSSRIIQSDLNNLKEQSDRNNIYETLKQIQSEDDFGNSKLENKEIKILVELTNLAKQDRYKEMLEVVKLNISNTTNNYFKTELHKRSLIAHDQLGNDSEESSVINKLIDMDGSKPEYYIYKSELKTDIEDKLIWLDKALDLNPYDSNIYNKKIKLLEDTYDYNLKPVDEYNSILELITKSIEINPSINNQAFKYKFSFLLKNKKEDQLEEVFNAFKAQDPYSINYLSMKSDLLKTDKERNDFIEEIDEAKSKYFHENKIQYEVLMLSTFSELKEREKIKISLQDLSLNETYKKSSFFLRNKALLLLEEFDELNDAIKVLKDALSIEKAASIIKLLIEYLLYNQDHEEAKQIYDKYKYSFSKYDGLKIKKEIFDKTGDYKNAYESILKMKSLYPHKAHILVSLEAYYLMHLNKYEEARSLLREYLKERNFDITLEEDIINYELCRKKMDETFSKKRLEQIKTKTKDNSKKAAINSIEGNKKEALLNIKLMIEENFTNKYDTQTWPVFDFLREEPEFNKLFK